ncbi:MAG: RNase adapter RapZ [Candidatus Eremiobacteraeota bacterium]|nr:RNase adapter RapZ [Candidatus Eremiobacteraeota bacterium]
MSERVVFVTGLSGAGKSQTMKTFEDLGFYCVDNLPPALAPQTLALLDDARVGKAALALDVRSGGPLGDALAAIALVAEKRPVDVLFLDARDDVLVRRYSETRRRHPFASAGPLGDAIVVERAALSPLRERATHELDTTGMTHALLKERIGELFAAGDGTPHLAVSVEAFGFKYGVPLDADLLFDVRFLRNPNYDDALRPLTGTDPTVAKYIEADPFLEPFLERLFAFVEFLIPRYIAEGKAQLTIAIGCTGGRHRSVYVACRLAELLERDARVSRVLELRDTAR